MKQEKTYWQVRSLLGTFIVAADNRYRRFVPGFPFITLLGCAAATFFMHFVILDLHALGGRVYGPITAFAALLSVLLNMAVATHFAVRFGPHFEELAPLSRRTNWWQTELLTLMLLGGAILVSRSGSS